MFNLLGLKTESQQQLDLSNPQQQKQILTALIGDLQKHDKKQKTEVVYDPVAGISQLFKLGAPQSAEVQSPKKQQKTSEKIKNFFISCLCCKSDDFSKSTMGMMVVLFNSLKSQDFGWLERHYNRYNHNELEQIRQQYISKMKQVLSKIRNQVEQQKVYYQLKASTLNCLIELESIYNKIQPKKNRNFFFRLNKQKDHLFILMISAFQVLGKYYTPYKRSKLKKMFQQLCKGSSSFDNSIQVLRFLENKDPIIMQLRPFSQKELDLQVDQCISEYMKMSRLQKVNTKIGLMKVSQSPKRRRVINLLISGFLSQDQDKKQQWNQLLACMPDSQVYGLQWQSNTINRLVKFLILSIKDVILGKDVQQLLTKDNPFIPAFQISIVAGEMLAYVVHKLFPHQFINIISYSLGSQLIRAFVQKTIELNGGIRLNNVISMGGVSDIQQFSKTLRKTEHTINILNVKTKHDSVLKYILKRAKPHIKPLGLNNLDQNIQNHCIKNVDVSKQINGHFSFMTNFGTIASLLMLSEE